MDTNLAGTNYLLHAVVGFINSEPDAENACRLLAETGFKYEMLHGTEAIKRFETATHSGILDQIKQIFQKSDDELRQLTKVAQLELEAGHHLFFVQTNGSDPEIERLRQLLVGQNAHSLVYFGDTAMRRLEPIESPPAFDL
ncbi:MAG: hypothetical protein F9K46_16165 [Anaerolineae bacterium]|nr:MAG: hypothetical protein F9K46_16165 [Anaerolineae bacterium]